MAKYIDAEKLKDEIGSRMEDCKLPDGTFPTTTNIVRYEELSCLRNFIDSLQQEQVEIHIDNPNIQKIDPNVKISTSDSSASGDELLYTSWRDEKAEQNRKFELIKKSWYMEGYYDREFNREPKWIIKTGEGGPRYEENPKYEQHIEKQDYSGLNDFERAIHRGFLCAGVVNVPVNIIKETAQDCLAHLPAEWGEDFDKEVENVHKRYPEVSYAKLTRIAYHFSKWANRYKDTEWGEDDETYLQDALWCIEKAEKVAKDEGDMGACWSARRWLKSLRPQQKQEWSEEDEKTRKDIIAGLEATKRMLYRADASGQACYNRWIDWLKSLKPHWKPSEEQMKMLAMFTNLRCASRREANILESLYNDLKKL